MSKAQDIADQLGSLPIDEQWVQSEINRLNRKSILPLGHVIAVEGDGRIYRQVR